MHKTAQLFLLLVVTLLLLLVLRWTHTLVFDNRQLLSIGVFTTFIYGTLLFGELRLAFAFGGIALLMMLNLLSVERFTEAASLDVLIFLIGTFLVVGYLEESRFFEHVVSVVLRGVGGRPQLLLAVLMGLCSIASALVGEVTAILFMAGAMLHLTSRYHLNPIPFVIMVVFAANTGSAMSSVGNPIGVMIALKTGLTFVDFLKWSAPVAAVVDVAVYAICRWWFADAFREFAAAVRSDAPTNPVPAGLEPGYYSAAGSTSVTKAEGHKTYLRSWIIFGALIVLLATHGLTERWLGRLTGATHIAADGSVANGLKEGTMMVATALIMGCVVLLLSRERARELVERRVDWWTIAFFMMLFASVGTLQDTQVTEVIATRISSIGGGETATIQIIGWSTGWLSAFLDNVLAVATFMPVVHDIRAKAGGSYSSAIYWLMLFGGTFMGNMTIIGSTANIVAVGLLERRGHGTVRFGQWFKIGFIVSIASMLIATAMLLLIEHVIGMPRLGKP